MTEIPEHLLKRSRERREAAGLPTEGGAAGGASTSSTPAPVAATPAKPAAAPAPAPQAAPPPKPVPAYVQAAQTRRKMPFWAMGALSLLPVWGFLYVRGLTPSTEVVEGPMGIGAEVYASCSTCHGATGAGGAGRPLNNGEVLLTFPNIEDQLNMVYTGSQAFELAGLPIYGDPDRPGGAHEPGWGKGAYMPQQGEKYGGALTEPRSSAQCATSGSRSAAPTRPATRPRSSRSGAPPRPRCSSPSRKARRSTPSKVSAPILAPLSCPPKAEHPAVHPATDSGIYSGIYLAIGA